jgi:hypothetical protein
LLEHRDAREQHLGGPDGKDTHEIGDDCRGYETD